jgi:hypothetical protein
MTDFQQIFGVHHPQPGYCLVLRPFNHSSRRAWTAVREELRDKFHWTDIQDLIESGTIMDQILIEIARTDVLIVDITGGNPNVFFELGIARAMKRAEKVLIVRRKGDGDDKRSKPDKVNGRVVPFDIRSERHLKFVTTDRGIRKMVRDLEPRLWAALEESQWFLLSEGERFSIGPLEGNDRGTLYDVELTSTRFVDRQFGPKAVKVGFDLAVRVHPGRDRAHQDGVRTTSNPHVLPRNKTVPLGPDLPWRLKFHGLEGDKARLCVESIQSSDIRSGGPA